MKDRIILITYLHKDYISQFTASDETAALWAGNSVNQLFRRLERIDLLLQQRVDQIQQR